MELFGESLTFAAGFFLLLALALAVAFEFVNGFHDTANAVATVIYTNTLKPIVAVVWSGCWNLLGAVGIIGGILGLFGVAAASGEVLLNDPFIDNIGNAPPLQSANNWGLWSLVGNLPGWALINAGAPVFLTKIKFSCITGGEDLPIGMSFQACNDPGFFLNPVTLYTVASRVQTGLLTNQVNLSPSTAYQYYRWNTSSTASARFKSMPRSA